MKRPPPNMRDWFEPPELERCPQCQRQSALKTLPAEYVICTECGVVGFDSERDSDHEH